MHLAELATLFLFTLYLLLPPRYFKRAGVVAVTNVRDAARDAGHVDVGDPMIRKRTKVVIVSGALLLDRVDLARVQSLAIGPLEDPETVTP
jgi:hypothetical protein